MEVVSYLEDINISYKHNIYLVLHTYRMWPFSVLLFISKDLSVKSWFLQTKQRREKPKYKSWNRLRQHNHRKNNQIID
jgi:hypothetical protein